MTQGKTGRVLVTGEPIRFERELVETGRHLELAAFRVEPETRRQVAVLFKDVTAALTSEEDFKQNAIALKAVSQASGQGYSDLAAYTLPDKVDIAQNAIDFLRGLQPDADQPYYLYVVDRDDRLIGIVGLRDLLVAQVAGDASPQADATDAERRELANAAREFSESDLVRFFRNQ